MKRILVSNGNPLETVVGFCRAVRVGSLITVGGTAPVDQNGNTVGLGDPAVQAKQCLEIIKTALEKAGSGMQHVVRTRILLTDITHWKQVVAIRAAYFREVRPVDTIMQVSQFVNPEWLVEIEADAVISDDSKVEIIEC